MALGDVNGDRRPDLVTGNQFGAYGASVLLNRGHGVFRASANYLYRYGAQSVAIGDVTGDGKPDLAFATGFTDAVSVLVNNGHGRFLQQLAYPTAAGSAQPISEPVQLLRLADAERVLVRANCRVGTVGHAHSKKVSAGLVLSQRPGFGLVGPRGGRVNLVVSLGRR